MTREVLFEIWAPSNAAWSPWAKPVLFAHILPGDFTRAAAPLPPPPDLSAIPPADGRTLLVLDLPNADCISAALQLAARGYRPVPLYNAVPYPSATAHPSMNSVCDLDPIVTALCAAAPTLAAIPLPPDAPPAFLLDSHRSIGTARRPAPGLFDNRSVSLPTDFPSTNLLLSRGLTGAILIQTHSHTPQPDLSHTLLRYQQAGLRISALSLSDPSHLEPIIVSRPRFFRRLWHRFQATLGLRRHPLGGFGGLLPIPSAG